MLRIFVGFDFNLFSDLVQLRVDPRWLYSWTDFIPFSDPIPFFADNEGMQWLTLSYFQVLSHCKEVLDEAVDWLTDFILF